MLLRSFFCLFIVFFANCREDKKDPSAAKVSGADSSSRMARDDSSDPEKWLYLFEIVGLDRQDLSLSDEKDRQSMRDMGVDPEVDGSEGSVVLYFNSTGRASSRMEPSSRPTKSIVDSRNENRSQPQSPRSVADDIGPSRSSGPIIENRKDINKIRVLSSRDLQAPVAVARMRMDTSSEALSPSVSLRIDPELRAQITKMHDQNISASETRVSQAVESISRKDTALKEEVFSRENQDGFEIENLIIGRGDTGFRVYEEFGLSGKNTLALGLNPTGAFSKDTDYTLQQSVGQYEFASGFQFANLTKSADIINNAPVPGSVLAKVNLVRQAESDFPGLSARATIYESRPANAGSEWPAGANARVRVTEVRSDSDNRSDQTPRENWVYAKNIHIAPGLSPRYPTDSNNKNSYLSGVQELSTTQNSFGSQAFISGNDFVLNGVDAISKGTKDLKPTVLVFGSSTIAKDAKASALLGHAPRSNDFKKLVEDAVAKGEVNADVIGFTARGDRPGIGLRGRNIAEHFSGTKENHKLLRLEPGQNGKKNIAFFEYQGKEVQYEFDQFVYASGNSPNLIEGIAASDVAVSKTASGTVVGGHLNGRDHTKLWGAAASVNPEFSSRTIQQNSGGQGTKNAPADSILPTNHAQIQAAAAASGVKVKELNVNTFLNDSGVNFLSQSGASKEQIDGFIKYINDFKTDTSNPEYGINRTQLRNFLMSSGLDNYVTIAARTQSTLILI